MIARNEELELLLPWYVNGTLDAKSRQEIDEALAHDERLRRALELARDELEAVLAGHAQIKPPSTAPLDRIMAEIATTARAKQHIVGRSLADGFKSFLMSLSPPALAAAAAAATVVIALQSATIGLINLKSTGPELASVEPGLQSQNTARFIVGFTDEATAREINALLDGAALQIVSGPTGGGLYVVERKSSVGTGETHDEILKQLQARRDIIMFSASAPGQEK